MRETMKVEDLRVGDVIAGLGWRFRKRANSEYLEFAICAGAANLCETHVQLLLDKFGIEPRKPEKVEFDGYVGNFMGHPFVTAEAMEILKPLVGKRVKVTVEVVE